MFKIGDFSKISQVSMRMLRHYDEIGLLKPAQTDPFTGYRYYSVDQLPRLNRILVLKDLGLSLEQISRLLEDDVPAAEMRGMLKLKQAELFQQVADEQARLRRVESRLAHIEQEGRLPDQDALVKKIPPQTIVSLREVAPDLRQMGDRLFEAYQAVRRHGIDSTGLALFYDAHYEESHMDWEIGFTVSRDDDRVIVLNDQRQMTVRQLPGVEQMACLLYAGSYFGLHTGYSALGTWIAANGYRINGVGREVFLRIGDLNQQDTNMTEIQFPVEKVALPS